MMRMEGAFGRGLRVLLVDDEPIQLKVLAQQMLQMGFEVEASSSLTQAMESYQARRFDLVITDMVLADGNGLSLAQHVHESADDCEVVIITGFASLETAIEAIHLRVADYFVKPMHGAQIRERTRRVVEHLLLKREHRQLQKRLHDTGETLQALQAQVVRDPLTGLFNHAYFQDQLLNELSRCRRYGHKLGLLFIDLDRFKQINDNLGHQEGDLVLKTIAEILQGEQSEDGPGFRLRDHDIAARYGGDEFVLILPETDKAGASTTAERLRRTVEYKDLTFDKLERVSLSIGVAGFPDDASNRDELIAAADKALYSAKGGGRNRVVTYQQNLDSDAGRRFDALERTLLHRALDFAYQPILQAETGDVFGYEAFCRPEGKAFADPADLLATAEDCGKVQELGRVLRELAVTRMENMAPEQVLFINLHPLELHDPSLLDDANPLFPFARRIVYEVNNSRRIADQARLNRVLLALREKGYRVLLDDLCRGYMGLNSLMRLEPDFVKMSPGLLKTSRAKGREARLLKHYLDYTRGEGIQVIATHIETEDEKTLALELGCPLVQGHYYAQASFSFKER